MTIIPSLLGMVSFVLLGSLPDHGLREAKTFPGYSGSQQWSRDWNSELLTPSSSPGKCPFRDFQLEAVVKEEPPYFLLGIYIPFKYITIF